MSFRSWFRTLITFGRGVTLGIAEATAGRDPIDLFGEWFDAARRSGIIHPEAMTLATSSNEGRPSARMVLLKGLDQRGFVFFGNHESRKAQELAENPRAALLFHWAVLERQVRIEGTVTTITTAESEAYFKTRPRGAQIGAWASKQSSELEDRRVLEQRVKDFQEKFAGGEVPLPPFWGGYRLQPERIEFWQGRADRLHDRLVFEKEGDGWVSRRLYP